MRTVRMFVFGYGLFVGLAWLITLIVSGRRTRARSDRILTATKNALATPPVRRDFREAFALAELFHYGRNHHGVDLRKARQFYEEAHSKAPSASVRGWCALGLGDTWVQEHRVRNAVLSYLEAVANGHDDGVLRIGDVYVRGAHPHVLPDKLEAVRLYQAFDRAPTALGKWCASRSRDIGTLRYDADAVPNGHETEVLPKDIVGRVRAALEERARAHRPTVECSEGAPPPPIDDSGPPLPIQLELPRPRVRNDMQNVHDTALQNAGIKTLSMCDQSGTSTSDRTSEHPYSLKSFRQSLGEDGRRVFDSLKDVTNERYGRSERAVLQSVWSRIHHPQNREQRTDLLKALRDNLESGVEHDHVVCSSGKIARMLATLEVLDADAVPLRPEWAIKEEIARMVGTTLMNTLERSSEDVRNAYNEPTPTAHQTDMADRMRERVRDEVRRRCEREYAEVVDATKIALFLDPLLEHI